MLSTVCGLLKNTEQRKCSFQEGGEFIILVTYNYDSLEKTIEAYKSNTDEEIIYIQKSMDEWMTLSLSDTERLITKLLIITREASEGVGLIKPLHLQSDEYRKGTAEAMLDED